MAKWQLYPEAENEDALMTAVIHHFTEMYQHYFREEFFVNHNLPIEIRGYRQSDPWHIFLLLTPWMLARLFIPIREPNIELPSGWQAEERTTSPVTVIGPAIPLAILSGQERAHLNYHPQLGHYLIQPLIQAMTSFNTSDEAFQAWNEVIKKRNQVIAEQQKQCTWQQEVSRREFFAKLRRRVSPR
ncbi:MAG: [NiFe]-hydrogenase assembly chaperone HybE [Pseudomonadota bacterium]|nr:[NiFe]-hydrogenase assembly chaperone HybE [Pseudomonadota bacterium]